MKSTDGKTWEKTGATSVSIDDKTITFTPDGSDIGAGVYYKFISVSEVFYKYQSGTKTCYPGYWDAPWYIHVIGGAAAVGVWILANGWEEPIYDNHIENWAQVSTWNTTALKMYI